MHSFNRSVAIRVALTGIPNAKDGSFASFNRSVAIRVALTGCAVLA